MSSPNLPTPEVNDDGSFSEIEAPTIPAYRQTKENFEGVKKREKGPAEVKPFQTRDPWNRQPGDFGPRQDLDINGEIRKEEPLIPIRPVEDWMQVSRPVADDADLKEIPPMHPSLIRP